jgi:hypothetical protein
MAGVLTLRRLFPGRPPNLTHSIYLIRPLLPAGQFHTSAILRAGTLLLSIKEVSIKTMMVADQYIYLNPRDKVRPRNSKQALT